MLFTTCILFNVCLSCKMLLLECFSCLDLLLVNINVYSDIKLLSITKFEVTLKISYEKLGNHFLIMNSMLVWCLESSTANGLDRAIEYIAECNKDKNTS